MHYKVHYKAKLMNYNLFYNALYIKALSKMLPSVLIWSLMRLHDSHDAA